MQKSISVVTYINKPSIKIRKYLPYSTQIDVSYSIGNLSWITVKLNELTFFKDG
jgi:hypothetical protein